MRIDWVQARKAHPLIQGVNDLRGDVFSRSDRSAGSDRRGWLPQFPFASHVSS
jgi:hypothetical protein